MDERRAGKEAQDALVGFQAKLDRAREHLRELRSAVDGFFVEGKTYSITPQPNPEPDVFLFRIDIAGAPLVAWSLIIGDCVHNIRSALDHLFWALLLKRHPNGDAQQLHRAIFPIIREPSRFAQRRWLIEHWVGGEATALLEQMQPFNSPDPKKHGMLFVNESDVHDKHKLLLPILYVSQQGEVRVESREDYSSAGLEIDVHRWSEGHAMLIGIRIRPHQAVVKVKINPTLGIAFSQAPPGSPSVADSLERFIEIVEGVCPYFEPLLRSTPT